MLMHTKARIHVKIDVFHRFYNSMSHIVVERTMVPWLQLDFLFHLFPQGAAQKRSLSILHDFSDRVS